MGSRDASFRQGACLTLSESALKLGSIAMRFCSTETCSNLLNVFPSDLILPFSKGIEGWHEEAREDFSRRPISANGFCPELKWPSF